MAPVFSLVGGGSPPRRPAYADILPDRVLVEYPATITMVTEPLTGQVSRIEISAMPDRAYVFDADTWHPLHPEDTALRAFLADFDPRVERDAHHNPIKWIEKDETA